ncbi:hypothetical protein AK830_g1514 [Neonectria ditissima]|uniref:Cas1p 10 TM acyl transferase domain-containing protein n=1 Tax=Neonectria ditissima TaxID=78410 RepID=A0A0P7BU25_9HYPO|nr:hypothetical protein AK830_g1514 [Neonectria ditissima]
MASVLSRILLIFSGVLLLAAVVYQTVVTNDDPYRCRAALETGRWIDHPNKKGERLPFKQWQPDGCLFHKYNSAEIRQCMEGRTIVFSGDSTTREVVYGIGRLLDRDHANFDREERWNHDHKIGLKPNLTYHGINLNYTMNPFLKTTGFRKWSSLVDMLELFREEREKPPPVEDQKGPALIMLGAGAWFSHTRGDDDPDWFGSYKETVSNASAVMGKPPTDFITAPMDPVDGVGNLVFFAPPAGPSYQGKNKDRIEIKAEARVRVKKMQQWLHEEATDLNFPIAWAIRNLMTQNKTFVDPKGTGFHAIDIVAETKANIYLNLRCNAKLDRLKGYPYERTCCTDYGTKPHVQLAAVAVGLVYLVVCLGCETWDLVARREGPRWRFLSMETGVFVMALLMCYYADRTQMMAKGDKLWSYADFAILCAPCVAVGLVTIRRSEPPRSKPGLPGVAPAAQADQPFLSRDQTEEWKGWMQFLILVYHWTAASRSPTIYITIRLLVAAYLFQTGYGHTTFFLVKKDFSFKRVASVLLRLNLLACSLAYFMNTDYMFYYFSPLVSFWFLVVYATLAVGHRRFNDNVQLVLVKICVSVVVVALIVLGSPMTRWTFALLRLVFNIQWSLQEWEYRVALDLFVVYVGMLAAIANLKTDALHLVLRCAMALVGVMIIWGYWFSCSTKLDSMGDYRLWHPYISFAPILAFIAIRNVASPFRNYYSKAMAWLGRCSLETYTLQFHLFLAADTEGILLLPFTGDGSLRDRGRSLIFIVPVFLWVSSLTATATGNLVNMILSTAPPPEPVSEIQLSDLVEKEGDEGSETDSENVPFLDDPDATPLTRSRARVSEYLKQVPSARSVVCSLQARILLILLVMWGLNMLSPRFAPVPVPDGYNTGPQRTPVQTPGPHSTPT